MATQTGTDSFRTRLTKRLPGPVNQRDVLPAILLSILLAGLVAVASGALLPPRYQAVPALLWSLGFGVSGMLLGFLFGIPRSLPSDATATTTGAVQPDGASIAATGDKSLLSGTPAPMEINSNLVEVSDWLTKIIVGVGLIELKSLPAAARSMTSFIAPSLAIDTDTARAIVGAIMLFFSVHGFLTGYLLTRIYLSIIIKRADNLVKNESVLLDSGKEIEVSELSRLQQKSLEDMQEAVTQILLAEGNDGANTAGSAAIASLADQPSRQSPIDVLWLDDHPRNNTLLVEQLVRQNIRVDLAQSTVQALSLLSKKPYALLITDMARLEGGQRRPDAGVQTVREVRQLTPSMPIIVYCSKDTAVTYGQQAEAAGANFITTSGISLLANVSKLVRGQFHE
ncbi:response regulator [Janthinobacterium aquaticum]|uniref:response regulator n=1 Tax=Janthinobacterium sp. FT58W TaxID=2654254 RepID=UPI00186B2DCF|nr:response regulator [Janthinobacterium sp. FT58W]